MKERRTTDGHVHPGHTSGEFHKTCPVACRTDGTRYYGAPLTTRGAAESKGKWYTDTTPEHCRNLCGSHEGCEYFNYFPDGRCLVVFGTGGTHSPTFSVLDPTQLSGHKSCKNFQEWTREEGLCRGGTLKWDDLGTPWKCLPNQALTADECKQHCEKTDDCWGFDRPRQDAGPCCLFKKGWSGNGGSGHYCHVKMGSVRKRRRLNNSGALTSRLMA